MYTRRRLRSTIFSIQPTPAGRPNLSLVRSMEHSGNFLKIYKIMRHTSSGRAYRRGIPQRHSGRSRQLRLQNY
jgi:hypothetical protein